MERIVNDLSVRIERLEGIVESSSKDLDRIERDISQMWKDTSELSKRIDCIEEKLTMCTCKPCRCDNCDCK